MKATKHMNTSYYKYTSVFNSIRQSKWSKIVIFLLVAELISGNVIGTAWALTSGPGQPEASEFQPASVTDLVDPFTGDFSYNVPVMEIGGYPINLSYASGATMDQEATWVGLGWNLNTGAIVRNLRGLPDDFNGDPIVKEYNVKDNVTHGINLGLGAEAVGLPIGGGASFGIDVSHNNYTGFNIANTISPSISAGNASKGSLNAGLGITSSSSGGLTIAPNVSFSAKNKKSTKNDVYGSVGIGLSVNSRSGLGSLTLSGSFSAATSEKNGKVNSVVHKLAEQGKKKIPNRSMNIGAVRAGANISFARTSFSPMVDQSFHTDAFTFNAMIGVGNLSADIDLKAGGYYSGQKLSTHLTEIPSYGYMYSEGGQNSADALHDFNREKDGVFTPKTTTNLAVTNYTYDVYQIQAQGLAGSIRPFRNDASYIHDNTMVSPSTSGSLGFELSVTNIVDGGLNVSVNGVKSESGLWNGNNSAKENMPFSRRQPNNVKEKFHFRMAGEQTVDSDLSFYNATGQEDAVRFTLDGLHLNRRLTKQNGPAIPFSNTISRGNRQNRVSSVEYLTVSEVKKLYPHRAKLIANVAKTHHIGQITVVKPDGTRYVFGLPAYNTTQSEVTFTVGTNAAYPTLNDLVIGNNTISYTTQDRSISNKKGIDNRYENTTTPAYVHTWYLTEILSPDYVDVTGDGPSDDDIGTYTMLEYGVYDASVGHNVPNISNYKWRTPVDVNSQKAGYNKNLHTDTHDDVANILYGEKQVWYVDKIVSKTQVCKFYLEDREDGYGVTGIDGGVASINPLKKIKKIALYSKEDWNKYEANPSGYVPLAIKTAHFEYSYELCKNLPNNTGTGDKGKLTLKSVWFTFEKSGRARYSPYTFEYSSVNPDYNIKAYDRWGQYKPAPAGTTQPDNSEFPYTGQVKANQDSYSSAWNLTKIKLPSGGIINVEYESDDYAYVQDRQASRMFKVVGAGSSASYTNINNDKLYTPSPLDNQSGGVYLFFELENSLSGLQAAASDAIKKMYVEGEHGTAYGPQKYLYFRFYINVDDVTTNKEYVSGYAEIDMNNILAVSKNNDGVWDHAAIKIKNVGLDDGSGNENPISKAAWQFSRLQTPRLAFNQTDPTDDSFEGVMNTLSNANFITNLIEMFKGVNRRLRNQGLGSEFDVNKSWIRLLDPDGIKYGGGHRVKLVEIDDNWAVLNPAESGSGSFSYGQTYEYKLENGKSSGVASWEPSMGADENPFRLPIFMSKEVILAPDEDFYIEEPLGEGLFPSASVGYSRVIVKNKAHNNVTTNATGKIVHEFYTAKDFPTKVKSTTIDFNRQKSPFGFSLLANIAFDIVAATQGYCVITNDMHGKAHVQTIYDEAGTKISQTTYDYQRNGDELNNNVKVINTDGSTEDRMIGVDYDFIADMREMQTKTTGGGAQINAALFLIGILPGLIPTVFPEINIERTKFRSATTTKTIFKAGILQKTTVFDKGAIVATENVAYDSKTGEVLLTKVNNEYNKERYALNFPAHWAYDGMGSAAANWGQIIRFPNIDVGSPGYAFDNETGKLTTGHPITNMLVAGDELVQYFWRFQFPIGPDALTANSARLWVAQDEAGDKYLIKQDGNPFILPEMPIDLCFKVVRSGRRNMQTASIGSLELMQNPIDGSGNLNVDALNTLNASAMEYSERWRTNIFRTNVMEYTQMTCGVNAVGTRMVMLLNQLIENDALVRNYQSPLDNSRKVNLANGYNINGLMLADRCTYSYTSLASGYSAPSPWNTDLGLNNNAWMAMYFTGEAATPCPECDNILMIALSEQGEYETTDFEEIAHFSSVISIPDYLNLPSGSSYSYLVNNTNNIFITTALMNDGSTKDFLVVNNCPEMFTIESNCCTQTEVYNCDYTIVNPYLYGLLGNWRPLKSYTYLANRTPDNISAYVDRRIHGYFNMVEYFWQNPTSAFWTPSTDGQWKWTSEILAYNNAGAEVENINPLNIYSSAVYGYKQTLPVIVAQNAKYKEIGFDGFEDYYLGNNYSTACYKEHFKLDADFWSTDYITNVIAHTGKYALKLDPAEDMPKFTYTTSLPQVRQTNRDIPYTIDHNDLLTKFSPDDVVTSKRYVLSFWVKSNLFDFVTKEYTDVSGVIKVGGVDVGSIIRKSAMIEGWQQFEYNFTVPENSTNTTVEFSFDVTGSIQYFVDDIRVHPFDATAKSFVYDARNLRFMAELDENNYATYYEYDDEGALVRVKKETERGVMTLKENRNYTYKRNP